MKHSIFVLALLFVFAPPAWATTFYVATTGSDSNTCTQAQSTSTPKLTIGSMNSCPIAGDTVEIRAGTYTGPFGSGMPSGADWNSPITYKAYTGETVTFAAPATNRALTLQSGQHHIIFDGLIFDGTAHTGASDVIKITSSGAGTGAHHIRIQNSEVKQAGNQAILMTGKADGVCCVEILNNTIHDNGRFYSCCALHAIYFQVDDVLVKGNSIYNQNNGESIQVAFDSASNATITQNRLYDNLGGAVGPIHITLATGTGHKIFANLFYGAGIGVRVDGGAIVDIVNNTFNSTSTLVTFESGAGLGSVQNNIMVGSASWGVMIQAGAPSGIQIKNNLLYDNATNIQDGTGQAVISGNVTTGNAQFTNPAAGDYSIGATSTARDMGLTLTMANIDFIGTSRPQGAAYDSGAYEYITPSYYYRRRRADVHPFVEPVLSNVDRR